MTILNQPGLSSFKAQGPIYAFEEVASRQVPATGVVPTEEACGRIERQERLFAAASAFVGVALWAGSTWILANALQVPTLW